jgi:hypothetical protein
MNCSSINVSLSNPFSQPPLALSFYNFGQLGETYSGVDSPGHLGEIDALLTRDSTGHETKDLMHWNYFSDRRSEGIGITVRRC